MLKGIIIGILIYSLILTVVMLYKDNSGYFMVEMIDIIVAGPVAWVLSLIGYVIIKPLCKIYKKNKGDKKKEYKNKDSKYISRVVKKIVRNYADKKNHNDYFHFCYMRGSDYDEYTGWYDLLVKRPRYERLNKKFKRLMTYQKEETVSELVKYFDVVTEDMMRQDDCNEYYIEEYKDRGLYRLKRA
jgi:hypothetical protein